MTPGQPTTLLERARDLALHTHAQQRYGDQPYSVHLEAVQGVLKRFGLEDEEILAAGWLHDILEDHPNISRSDIERQFPESTVAIVDACTDGPGQSRQERKKRPLELIPKTPNAVLVKLADRIANVEASAKDCDAARLEMYRREQAAFIEALRDSPATPPADPLWAHLEQVLR
jgi:(p)ppGpp synthase/HD superfamily hydrolase